MFFSSPEYICFNNLDVKNRLKIKMHKYPLFQEARSLPYLQVASSSKPLKIFSTSFFSYGEKLWEQYNNISPFKLSRFGKFLLSYKPYLTIMKCPRLNLKE